MLIIKAQKFEWRKLVQFYDEEGLVEIYPAITQNIINEFSEIDTNRVVWLAEKETKVIGTISLVLDCNQKDLADGNRVAMVKRLRVSKEHEGKGVAKKLYLALEDEARRRGFDRLSIEVAIDNSHAREIYKHWGYTFLRDGFRKGELALIKALHETEK